MHFLNDRRNEEGQVTREKDLPCSRQAQLLRTEQENPEARSKSGDQRPLKYLGAKKASQKRCHCKWTDSQKVCIIINIFYLAPSKEIIDAEI